MGCNSSKPESLYLRLGGESAISAATKALYEKILEDPLLQPYFENVDMTSQMAKFEQFITFAFGGPTTYANSDMKAVHAHLKITSEAFDKVAQHLSDVLDELKVSEIEKNDVMNIVAPLKDDIVSVQ